MDKIFIEENGVYGLLYEKAIWATDQMHEEYHKAGLALSDADFLLENEENILIVEYKNANIEGASCASAFKPENDKKFNNSIRKFFDSLHYLRLLAKNKPVVYVYVLEYPNGDSVTRKRLRERMKKHLPFALQENMNTGIKLIEKVDVVSIEEWNSNKVYGMYPIVKIQNAQ